MIQHSCDVCGQMAALPFARPHSSGHLCPSCARDEALFEAAAASLHALLWPITKDWVRHWHAAGCDTKALAGILDIYGIYWHNSGELARPHSQGNPISQAIQEALK